MCQTSHIYIKKDLYTSKEINKNKKRPAHNKREHSKRPVDFPDIFHPPSSALRYDEFVKRDIKRDLYTCKETNKHQKRPLKET